jgi:hypothetical protein
MSNLISKFHCPHGCKQCPRTDSRIPEEVIRCCADVYGPNLPPSAASNSRRCAADPSFSALLILALSASVSACVAATGSGSAAACSLAHSKPSHPRTAAATADNNCGHSLRARSAHCSLRGLLQFQFLTLPEFQIGAPLDLIAVDIMTPPNSTAKLTSIGSPETDRGPPRSR